MAADARPSHAGRAGVVRLAAPARCRPAGGRRAPTRGRGHRPATGAAHGPTAGAAAERDGVPPGGLGATRHPAGRHRVAAGRRPAPVSGPLASGTGGSTHATGAPAQAQPEETPHPCGSHGTGVAQGLGCARSGDGHDPGSPAHRHAQGASAGQSWVAHRLRPRDRAAARLWSVVTGPGADMRATLASLCSDSAHAAESLRTPPSGPGSQVVRSCGPPSRRRRHEGGTRREEPTVRAYGEAPPSRAMTHNSPTASPATNLGPSDRLARVPQKNPNSSSPHTIPSGVLAQAAGCLG